MRDLAYARPEGVATKRPTRGFARDQCESNTVARPGHKRLMSASFVPPASIRLWVTIAASVNVK